LKIFVFGYFGRKNLGDEAILEAFLNWSRKNIPDSDYRVLTSSKEWTSEKYDVEPVAKNDLKGILRAIKWADVVLAPGGGILQDSTSAKSVVYYAALIKAAGFFKKPVFMMSQGMGPLKREWIRNLVKKIINKNVKFIWVRDEKSLNLLRDIGVDEGKTALGADMAFYFFKGIGKCKPQKDNGTPLRIAVSLRPCEGLEHTSGVLEGALLRLREERKIELFLFAFDGEQDVPVVNKFAEEIRRSTPEMKVIIFGESRKTPPSAAQALELLSDVDIVIGMRLHSLILAAIGGTPFIGLCYDPKVEAFTKACGQTAITDPKSVSPLELDQSISKLISDGCQCSIEKIADAGSIFESLLSKSLNRLYMKIVSIEEQNYDVLGIPVSGLTLKRAVRKIIDAVEENKKIHIVTLNPEMVLRAGKEIEFRNLLLSGVMNTADGIGIRMAVKRKYRKKIDAVTGIDIMEELLKKSKSENLRIFMLGSKPEIIEKCAENIIKRDDSPIIAGYHHGYLKDVSRDELIDEINRSDANIILVGMGVPAQEYWIRDNAERLTANVFVGVGGSFDVFSGEVKRAPSFFRKIGMEWFYRFLTNPSRIKRIAGFPLFLIRIQIDAIVRKNRSNLW